MMKELGLREEDLDDVVFDEKEAPPDAVRWIAVAKVHSSKTYSQYWFFKNMRAAWDLAQEVKFKPLDDNLYTIQFSCLGDWERVTLEGPWHFRGDAVIIKPYDGLAKPSTIPLDTIEIWVQIHDVPDLYAHLVPSLASKIGEVLYAEPNSQDFVGNFHRVWVRIDVMKPLKNAVSMIRDGKRQIYRVKYEKLPDWCAVCGMLGHLFKEHGNGIHPPSALVFKELRATWTMRSGRGPGNGSGRRGGRRGGRNGGSGRGERGRPEETEAYGADNATDDLEMQEADYTRKRAPNLIPQVAPHATLSKDQVLQLALPLSGAPPSPSGSQDMKRAKTPNESEKTNVARTNVQVKGDMKMAGPSDGRRRGQ